MESTEISDKIHQFFTSFDEILSLLELNKAENDHHFTQLIVGIQNRLRPYENIV